MANDFQIRDWDLSQINGGKELIEGQNVPTTFVNAPVEMSKYSVEYVKALAQTPDSLRANEVGTPTVEIVDDGKGYKKFVFRALKGEQGFGWAASVTRDTFTEAKWTEYGETGHTENWSNTASIRNNCRVGDIFSVVGTATDTGNSHVLFYKSTTDSGDLKGTCFGHYITLRGKTGATGQAGATGATGPKGNDGVSVTSILQTVTSVADGGSNIITVTLSNGAQSTFTIKNGNKGSTGLTPEISAEATISGGSGEPEVQAYVTGTKEKPILHFAFGNLQGQKGQQGDKGNGVADGGTKGQVLIKQSTADGDTRWGNLGSLNIYSGGKLLGTYDGSSSVNINIPVSTGGGTAIYNDYY